MVLGTRVRKAFQDIKYFVTNVPVLTYFNPLKGLEIQFDSSKFGIGSVLLQGGQRIAYASTSRAMIPTEV